MKQIIIGLLAIVLFAAESVAAGKSRLETDFARQRADLMCYEGPTSEESCGGAWLTVYMAGKEIRKLEWDVETSWRLIRREFYFSRGKPQLVIEASHFKLDDTGERLEVPRHEYTRRFWLHDTSAGRRGIKIRRELQAHVTSLLSEFSGHRAGFPRTGN